MLIRLQVREELASRQGITLHCESLSQVHAAPEPELVTGVAEPRPRLAQPSLRCAHSAARQLHLSNQYQTHQPGWSQDVGGPPMNLSGDLLGTMDVPGEAQRQNVPIGEAEPGNAALGRLRRRLVAPFGHSSYKGYLS